MTIPPPIPNIPANIPAKELAEAIMNKVIKSGCKKSSPRHLLSRLAHRYFL